MAGPMFCYFTIGKNIIQKDDKVIQILEEPNGRYLIDATCPRPVHANLER